MITEQARVINISGSGIVELEVQRQTACGQCEVKGACGVGAIGRLLGTRKPRISLSTELPLKKGDTVKIGIPEGALVKTSFAIYLIPLLALMAAAIVGQTVFNLPEWLNLAFSSVVAGLAWFITAARIPSIEVRLLSQLN